MFCIKENNVAMDAAIVTLGCAVASYFIWKHMFRLKESSSAFNYLTIRIITNERICDTFINELKRLYHPFKAVGFDCEWVTEEGKRHPVALLQLSTHDGLCGLFRLGHMETVPTSLKEFLEDETIYKVGVAPKDDAKYLLDDYGVFVRSTLDIRHLVQVCGYSTGGLAALAKIHLGIILDKSWTVRCSNWDAQELTTRQINYAAADAHVAIRIFVKLVNSYNKKGVISWFNRKVTFEENWNHLQDAIEKLVDSGFKPIQVLHDKGAKHSKRKESRHPHAIRSKPLYENCFLLTPDSELLCTMDNKKAQWYVDKGLADMVCEEPLTVKMRFEPVSRMIGDADKYYQLTKENKCVVCGKPNTYIKKNVVPREYRKYFPGVMKGHSSHDVLLLCVECHRDSSIADQAVRVNLNVKCGANISTPLINGKYIEQSDLKFENPEYESSGLKVVKYYLEKGGGLLKLEQLWREHFLKAMKPQHLPALWSVTHTEERMRIRRKEGRLSEEEMKQMGVNWP